MVMITIISAMMMITKYSLPTIDLVTRYSLQSYSNHTRSKKSLLVGACRLVRRNPVPCKDMKRWRSQSAAHHYPAEG